MRDVLIEIDGREVATARRYLPRLDVEAAYPAITGARASGWLARVDVAQIDRSHVNVAAIAVTRDERRVELHAVEVGLNRPTRSSDRSENAKSEQSGDVAVYTAIFGGYDELQPQPSVQGVDFICFTDDPSLSVPPWSVKLIAPRHPDPRMASRWLKLFPHRVLPGHRFTVHIDGSIRVRHSDSITRLLSILNDRGIALFPHPDRDSIQLEAEASLEMNKWAGLPLREQVSSYERRGLPAHRLYAGGIIVRDSLNRRIRRLGRLWWREIRRWGCQDQLILPFLFWKLGITPAEIPYDLWSNPLFAHDISGRRFEDL